jgi:catechol 2,3-dioxygenase-like lactoylglutathione lyase family enzyme
MFRDTRAFSGFAVPDTAAAKDFYGGTLGLEVTEEDGILTLHVAGGRPILVYPKPDHEPATYTILNFPVADVDAAVDRLVAAGVRFEVYDREDLRTDERGVLRGAGPTIAWFRDPAGNILSVIELPEEAAA